MEAFPGPRVTQQDAVEQVLGRRPVSQQSLCSQPLRSIGFMGLSPHWHCCAARSPLNSPTASQTVPSRVAQELVPNLRQPSPSTVPGLVRKRTRDQSWPMSWEGTSARGLWEVLKKRDTQKGFPFLMPDDISVLCLMVSTTW